MKLLQFAFGSEDGDYLPHSYGYNSICYIGTHDNPTLKQWLGLLKKKELAFAKKYCALSEEEGYDRGILRMGQLSPSLLFVAERQDYLGLADGCRINTPGVVEGNWRWRLLPGELTSKACKGHPGAHRPLRAAEPARPAAQKAGSEGKIKPFRTKTQLRDFRSPELFCCLNVKIAGTPASGGGRAYLRQGIAGGQAPGSGSG